MSEASCGGSYSFVFCNHAYVIFFSRSDEEDYSAAAGLGANADTADY